MSEKIARDLGPVIADAQVSCLMNDHLGHSQRYIHSTLETLSRTESGRQAIKEHIRYYQKKIAILKEYDEND